MKAYDHKKIEKKWQKEWESKKLYKVKDSVKGKENFYTLVEFTYPSGNLHVGHWYAFGVTDIFARYKRMKGYNVLYPMGFDAFGLPAENAAIKLDADPKVWTYKQMAKMRTQLKSMGAMFDWEREIVSCAPEYYKWTQWMFNQFLKKGLVYRDITKVNWCPKDQTILANEQVVDGICERCGAQVEQRNQEQWMLRITKYADKLIDDLDKLDWPEEIKSAQKNWIGRSEGSEIEFPIAFSNSVSARQDLAEKVKVFTTRADTLFGVTYIVLAPEHPMMSELLAKVENKSEIEKYIADTKKKSELDRQQSKEKTGVELKGIKVINPVNKEEVPVWIADYVLAGYGTGAVMAVPAHDERDFEFAKKYNLPMRRVVEPKFVYNEGEAAYKKDQPFIKRNAICAIVRNPRDDTYLGVSWKKFKMHGLITGGIEDGEDIVETAKREVQEETGYKNIRLTNNPNFALHTFFYHRVKKVNRWARFQYLFFDLVNEERDEISAEDADLHDIVWIPKDKIKSFFTVAEGEFTYNFINNPNYIHIEDGILHDSGEFTNLDSATARKEITKTVGGKLVKTYRLRDWGISRQRYWGTPIPIVYDPKGKAHPVPDKHLPWLLPTDVDHTPDGTSPLARSKELLKRTEKIFGKGWKPEVETMDTFVDSSWYFYRYLDAKNKKTFADKKRMNAWMPIDLYMGGAEHTTMHLLYSRFWVKAMHDLKLVKEKESYKVRRNRGLILGPDGNKMSKSKGNVIDPDEIVDRLGADTVRMYLAFMGPYGVTVNYPWDPNGVVGVRRFLERVWKLQDKVSKQKNSSGFLHSAGGTSPVQNLSVLKLLNKVIKKISSDMLEYKFNTAISQMMILLNEWDKAKEISKDEYKKLLQLLAPFAPHMTEELWSSLGEKKSIHLSVFPKWDEILTKDEEIKIAIQVNGKVRGEMMINIEDKEEDIKKKALENQNILKYVSLENVKKIIYVKGRLINIVL